MANNTREKKEYYAKTKKGGFPVFAHNVKEAWVNAKLREKEINDARKEMGLAYFNYRLCKVIKILRS